MEFEFDPAKSAANLAKHGLDFEAAQALWEDPNLIAGPARHPVERRYLALGAIDGRIWAVVYTLRMRRVRLISARPAKRKERLVYERAKGKDPADRG